MKAAVSNELPARWRHDARTSLGHVMGYTELLLEEASGEASERAALEQLLARTKAALSAVDACFGAHGSVAEPDRDILSQALSPHCAALAESHCALMTEASSANLGDIERMGASLQALERLVRVGAAVPVETGLALPASLHDTADGALVLVVDDDAGNRALLGRILAADGHLPAFAADGATAIEIASKRKVQLVLLDVEMPGVSGDDVLRALQSDAELRAIPVLMVSANDQLQNVARFIEMGAVDYLPKPFEMTLLRARIASCLEMKRLRDRDRALQKARTRLLASISHDLRQPLQAVRIYGDALLRWCDEGEARHLLRRQLAASDAAVDMLDQFSDFSAIEEGMLRSRLEPVDVLQVCREVCERLRDLHDADVMALSVAGSRRWALTDRTQFARIVQNLANNAVRSVTRRSVAKRPRVIVALRPLGGGLAIDVLDNGTGIPPDRCAEIFKPYVQLREADTPAGARGLGLAIVAGLSRQLDLSLPPVRSRLGRGSRFRVLIPASRLVSTPAGSTRPDAGAGDARAWFQGRLIGVIDDDEASMQGLVSALESQGARAVGATTLARLQSALDDELGLPDGLVADHDLTDAVDGIGVVQRLRQHYEHVVPAVIITGRIQLPTELPDRCMAIQKPVGIARLAAALAELSDSSSALTILPRPAPLP